MGSDLFSQAQHRQNNSARMQAIIRKVQSEGELPTLPFGSDFTAQELKLAQVLKGLTANAALHGEDLQWLPLRSPRDLKNRIERLLVLGALCG